LAQDCVAQEATSCLSNTYLLQLFLVCGKMFTEASRVVFFAGVVVACAVQAMQQVHITSSHAAVERGNPDVSHSNNGCNGQAGAVNGPFTCSGGFACVNIGYVIRHACQSCSQNNLMSKELEAQCRDIAQGGQTVLGVKVMCSEQWERTGCIWPAISSNGWTNLGSNGANAVCPCVTGYVQACKNQGLSCILDKIDECPHMCAGIKARIIDARAHSPGRAGKGSLEEDSLKDRANVLIDSDGMTSRNSRTSRNASASLTSLDHSVSGKCAEQ